MTVIELGGQKKKKKMFCMQMGGEAETVENEFSRNVRKVLYIGAICILPVTTKLTAVSSEILLL